MRFLSSSMLCLFLLSLSSSALALDAKDLSKEEIKARNGDVGSQVRIGDYYHAKGDFNKAFKWYQLAAENGHYDARRAIAYMYEDGQGTRKDLFKAYVLKRKMQLKYTRLKDRGEALGNEANRLAEQLTPEQLRLAEELIKKDWDF